jgi:SAM-dependent MidA family methyltransferase
MEEQNIHTELKENIEKSFAFLKDFGFSDFEIKPLFLKHQLQAKNDFVTICFESRGFGTLVTVNIDQYELRTLEPDNPVLEEIGSRHAYIYDNLFQQYIRKKKSAYSPELILETEELVEKYTEELSNLIKRHKSILTGDKELFKLNSDVFQQKL